MLMLSDDSFRILVSASEERSKPELGFLISEKGRFFEVVITHIGQLHGKLVYGVWYAWCIQQMLLYHI